MLAHVCREKSGWAMVALHNFGSESCIVPVQLKDATPGCTLIDLLDGRSTRSTTRGESNSAWNPTVIDGCDYGDQTMTRSSELSPLIQ